MRKAVVESLTRDEGFGVFFPETGAGSVFAHQRRRWMDSSSWSQKTAQGFGVKVAVGKLYSDFFWPRPALQRPDLLRLDATMPRRETAGTERDWQDTCRSSSRSELTHSGSVLHLKADCCPEPVTHSYPETSAMNGSLAGKTAFNSSSSITCRDSRSLSSAAEDACAGA